MRCGDGPARCNAAAPSSNCPSGQHEHMAQLRHVEPVFVSCHAISVDHWKLSLTEKFLGWASGEVICTIASGGAGKAAQLAKKGGEWIRKQVGTAVELGTNVGCSELLDKLEKIGEQKREDQKKEHDEDAQDQDDQDDIGGDSTGTDDDDSGGSEEDEDPEPTPGICDRNSAPTNPYKIGPSNTTPQQWADWWAWFDCP